MKAIFAQPMFGEYGKFSFFYGAVRTRGSHTKREHKE
jgi:hypothetical protein